MRASFPASVVALALAVAPLQAQRSAARVTVSGIVTDASSGHAVNGALIEFPELRRQATTDAKGRFAAPGLRAGKHKLVVNQLGFKTLVREVDVQDGELIFIALEPDPVMLKGIEVQSDRLESRRRGVATSVMSFSRTALLNHPALNASEFIRSRLNMFACGNYRQFCVRSRGQVHQPLVYIDERRAFGLDELNAIPVHDIYMIESYQDGRMIRVYTTWFMDKLARGKIGLSEIILGWTSNNF